VSEAITYSAPLSCWSGDRGTYFHVTIAGECAETIAMHARLRRLEYGRSGGFGSVKVMVRIGGTRWKSSVFPQNKSSEWFLLVSRKVMRAEDLVEGETLSVELELL